MNQMNEGPPGSGESMCKSAKVRKRRLGSGRNSQGIMTNAWLVLGELIVIKLKSESKALQSCS